jgi:hypothetical protein
MPDENAELITCEEDFRGRRLDTIPSGEYAKRLKPRLPSSPFEQ